MKYKKTEKLALTEDYGFRHGSCELEVSDEIVSFRASNYYVNDTNPVEFLEKAYKTIGEMIERVKNGQVEVPVEETKPKTRYERFKEWLVGR